MRVFRYLLLIGLLGAGIWAFLDYQGSSFSGTSSPEQALQMANLIQDQARQIGRAAQACMLRQDSGGHCDLDALVAGGHISAIPAPPALVARGGWQASQPGQISPILRLDIMDVGTCATLGREFVGEAGGQPEPVPYDTVTSPPSGAISGCLFVDANGSGQPDRDEIMYFAYDSGRAG